MYRISCGLKATREVFGNGGKRYVCGGSKVGGGVEDATRKIYSEGDVKWGRM
jgi:sulfite reductase alpha subunit-like flavoprotein